MAEFIWELPTPAATPSTTPSTSGIAIDHVLAAINRLPQQFKTKPKIVAIMTILCTPMNVLEGAFVDLLQKRSIDTAEGEQLNILGRLVGQEPVVVTSTTLRSLIRARVRANKSSGIGDQILLVSRLVLVDYASDPAVIADGGELHLIAQNSGWASFSIIVDQPDIPWDLAELLQVTFIRLIAGTAIRGTLEFAVQDGGVHDISSEGAFRLSSVAGVGILDGGGLGYTSDATIGGQLFAAME